MISLGSPRGSCSCQPERGIFPQIAFKAWVEWDGSAIFATVRAVAMPMTDLIQQSSSSRSWLSVEDV